MMGRQGSQRERERRERGTRRGSETDKDREREGRKELHDQDGCTINPLLNEHPRALLRGRAEASGALASLPKGTLVERGETPRPLLKGPGGN